MEAVPKLPMLCFDLKPNHQKNTEFGPDLMNLIRVYYREDPSNYAGEVQALEKLRHQAMKPSKDVEGIAILKRYFCQLYFLQKRFPMLKDGPANSDTSWRFVFSTSPKKVLDFRYEFTLTLYNIGALHTQLGAADDRTTADGLKLACTHFQCAAWAFQYLEEINSMKYRADFDPAFFQFLIPTCLAQAQECIAEKSITDNRKPNISAKVAAQICEYYGQADKALSLGKQEEIPIFDVNIKNSHTWINYLKYKKAYYECVSNLFLGMQAEEDQKMGERVAYFEGSAEKLKLAAQYAKFLELPQLYKGLDEALTFTRDIVEGKRKNAVSENDFIYHEEVPPRDNLPKIKGAVLVKCIGFDFNDPDISGQDIFAKLISMKAHHRSSIYSEEKAKLLRSVSSSVEEKDAELISFMQSLKLDYLHPHEDLNSLPEELVERCAACEAKPDLIQDLNEAMDKLTQDQYQVDDLMREVTKLIADEEKADAEYHQIMGTTPQPSIVSTDLKCEANRYGEALKKATESNESLRNAISAHVNNLRILSLPLDELEQHLPKITFDFPPDEDSIVRELRRLVDKVEEMRNQRALLMIKLRDALKNDDITEQIGPSDDDNAFFNMVTKEISKHQNVVSLIEQNLKAQSNILNALTNAYAAYAPIRKAIHETIQQRGAQINALIESFDVSDDVLKKAAKGLEFYGKLEGNVRKLLSRLKGTVKVQEDNRMQMYDKSRKSRPTPAPVDVPATPKLKDYIAYNKQFSKPDNDIPLPYNPYYAPPSNYAASRSDAYSSASLGGGNQYYSVMSHSSGGSEMTPLKGVGELTSELKNHIASTPATTYGTNYSTYGYTYSQPNTVNYPASASTGSNPAMNYAAAASTAANSGAVSYAASASPASNMGTVNYPHSGNTAANQVVTNYSQATSNAANPSTNYPQAASTVLNPATMNYPQTASTAANPGTMNYPQSAGTSYAQNALNPAAYGSAGTSYTQGTSNPVAYQQTMNYATPSANTSYTSTQDATNAASYQPTQAYQTNTASYQQPTYTNYTQSTSDLQAAQSTVAQAYSYPNYNANQVATNNLPASNATSVNQTPAYSSTIPNTYGTAYNTPSTAYPTVNYDSYPQSNGNVQNTMPQYNYNTYGSQYPYAGYTNYSSYPNYSYTNANPATDSTNFPNYASATSTVNAASSYTNAGQCDMRNIESTSKTVDGRSYVMQYAANHTDDMVTSNQQYYANQYGYQYQDSKSIQSTTDKVVPKVNDEGGRLQANRNSMTYMQASTNNNNTMSTYSVNGSAATQKKTESNVDLLADLDFQVSDTPLLPVPETTPAQITEKMMNLNVNADSQKINGS